MFFAKRAMILSKQAKADLALVGVAFIWGTTFVIVKDALTGIGPFYFLAWRFLAAFIFLALVFAAQLTKTSRELLSYSFIIGIFLFGGYALQTVGLQYTSAANAGFITGLSVVLVPLFGALGMGQQPDKNSWLGALVAAIGLYLLSGMAQKVRETGELALSRGDFLVFLCAICFAWHILLVGRYAPRFNPNLLAIYQILTVSLLSFIAAFCLESMPVVITREVWLAFAFTAIPATSLAFLVQNKVQRYTSPAHTAVIFTLEPVFAALTAFVWGHESLSIWQISGGVLIISGMLLAEFSAGNNPGKEKKKERAQVKELHE